MRGNRWHVWGWVLLGLVACETEQEVPLDPVVEAYLRQGSTALQHNDFGRALAYADSAETHTGDVPDAYFLRGQVHSEVGAFEQAETAYRTALDLDPNYRGVWHNLGNNAFRQHQYDEAVVFYRREIERHPAPLPWRGMGRAYIELGKVDSARYALEQALAADSTYAPGYFNLALLEEDEGAFDEALAHARAAVQFSPEDLDYRYLMGALMVKTGRNEEALPHLARVADAWPWHFASHYNLGQALVRLGHTEEGEAYLNRAETLRIADAEVSRLLNTAQSVPDDPFAYAALGTALRRAERYEDALRAYKVATHLDPSNLDIQVNLANLYLLQRDTSLAIQAYEAMLQQDSTYIPGWLNLGALLAMSGRLDDARRAWESVLRREPNHPAARAYLERLN